MGSDATVHISISELSMSAMAFSDLGWHGGHARFTSTSRHGQRGWSCPSPCAQCLTADKESALTVAETKFSLSRMDWRDLETFSFGDGPDLANRLLELVLSGTKCATCWAESQGLLSAEVGKMMVVLDGQGVPKAIVKTIALTKRRFDEVDEAFAYDEGEGDRSLKYWREAHTRYFTRLGTYAPDMMLWCERFELVERIG
jgi:uncharacterized protein YhfF